MKCYIHNDSAAIGTCVNCGKFICETCNTQITGKNYCKPCVSEVFESMKEKIEHSQKIQPTVYMNAGGASASSSASSSSSSSGRPAYRQSCLLHIILFILTGGIGNIIYYIWAKSR